MEGPPVERPDAVVTTSGHATVERRLDRPRPRRVVAEFTVTSTSDDPLVVEVVDRLPGNWSVTEISFDEDAEPSSGTTENDVVRFDVLVRPGEESRVVYRVTLNGAVDEGSLRAAEESSAPHVDDVRPASTDGTTEMGTDPLDEPARPSDQVDSSEATPGMRFGTMFDAVDDLREVSPEADPGTPSHGADRPDGEPVGERLLSEIESGTLSGGRLHSLRAALGLAAVGRTRARLRRMESRLEEFDAYVEELGAVIDEHGSVTDFAEALRDDVDALEARSASLRNGLDRAAEERAGLADRLDAASEVGSRNDGRLDDLEAREAATAHRLDDLEVAIEEVRDAIESLQTDVSALESELDSTGEPVGRWAAIRARFRDVLGSGDG